MCAVYHNLLKVAISYQSTGNKLRTKAGSHNKKTIFTWVGCSWNSQFSQTTFLILYFNSRSSAFFSPLQTRHHAVSLLEVGWFKLSKYLPRQPRFITTTLAHEFQPRWGFKENGKNFSSLRGLERNWRMSWYKVHLGKFSLAVEVFIRSDTPISRFWEIFLFSRALHLLELCGTGNWWPQHWRVDSPWCAHWGLEIFGMIHRWNHEERVIVVAAQKNWSGRLTGILIVEFNPGTNQFIDLTEMPQNVMLEVIRSIAEWKPVVYGSNKICELSQRRLYKQ